MHNPAGTVNVTDAANRTSAAVATTASSSANATVVGDFSDAVPGKPLLAALAAVFATLEPCADEAGDHSNVIEPRYRTRRRLSSTCSALGFAAVDAVDSATTSVSRDEFVLRINAPCLFYLQELFRAMLAPVMSDSGLVTQWRVDAHFADMLEDAEATNLGPASPINVLTLGGHLLEQTALVVHGAASVSIGAPAAFDLALFPRLQYLRLDSCVLRDVQHLSAFLPRLKELRCYNEPIGSLAALLDVSTETAATSDQHDAASDQWVQLESFAAVNCSLKALDASALALLPRVTAMRLSGNALQELAPLAVCSTLQTLDLSRNAVASTTGLEHLRALEVLDLSHNAIARSAEVARLAVLPNLHSLRLRGNPIARSSAYRGAVQRLLTAEVMLDDEPWECPGVDAFAKLEPADLDQGPTPSSNHGTLKPLPSEHHDVLPPSECVPDAVAAASPGRSVAAIARSVLLAVGAIAVVHSSLGLMRDTSDDANEQLLRRVLALLATGAALLLATSAAMTRTADYVERRRAVAPSPSELRCSDIGTASPKGRYLSLRRFSRQLLMCLVSDTYVRQDAIGSAMNAHGSNRGVSLDVLHASLERLAESPEELSLLVFLNVCVEVQHLLALLSPADGDGGAVFACNALARAVAALEASARDLRTATVHDVLADTAADTVAAMHEALDVLAFTAQLLLALTDQPLPHSDATAETEAETASALHAHALAAYHHVFAASHSWLVQRAVAESIAASPLTPRAFFAALQRGNERRVGSEQALTDWLRGCGQQLQTLHDQLEAQML